MKTSTVIRKRPPTKPTSQFEDKAPEVDAAIALATAERYVDGPLVNAHVWPAMWALADEIFPDNERILSEHHAVEVVIHEHLGQAFYTRYESVWFAQIRRFIKAAYILGIAAGRRTSGDR